MAITLPAAICDLGVFGYLYLNAIQLPNPEALITPERLISLGGVLLAAGFFAGQIWKDFKGSKTKIVNDDGRIRSLEKRLRIMELERAALRATFTALLGRFDIEKTRLSEIGAELASYDVEEPTDDGNGSH